MSLVLAFDWPNQYDLKEMVTVRRFDGPPNNNSNESCVMEPEEVSVYEPQNKEPECLEKILATTTVEGKIDIEIIMGVDKNLILDFKNQRINVFPTDEFDYTESVAVHNEVNSFLLSDGTERVICHPIMSTQPDENESHSMASIQQGASAITSIYDDSVVEQTFDPETDVAGSSYFILSEERPMVGSPHTQARSPQELPSSLHVRPALHFVHDVHPYQKTQHDIDTDDKSLDLKWTPYIMRIQGIKTDADKGRTILPRIWVSTRIKT